MKKMKTKAAIGLILILSHANLVAGPSSGPGDLIEGKWIHHGLRTVLGEGVSTEIELVRKEQDWTISFKDYQYFSVNERKKPEILLRGPFKVSAENRVIRIAMPKGIESYTFTISDACLTMPAIVQQGPGIWAFEKPGEKFLAECEHDPFSIPVGRVKLPWIATDLNFYIYEESPRSAQLQDTYARLEKPSYNLRFMERTEDGHLAERFRFVFDRFGQPRHQRIGSTRAAFDDRLTIIQYNKEMPVTDPFAALKGNQLGSNEQPSKIHGEQVGAGQPATRPESNSERGEKPQPESEGRSR